MRQGARKAAVAITSIAVVTALTLSGCGGDGDDDPSGAPTEAPGNTSGEPVIIFGLPAGPHKLEITLVNPNHQPLGRSVVQFVIPPRDAAPKSH